MGLVVAGIGGVMLIWAGGYLIAYERSLHPHVLSTPIVAPSYFSPSASPVTPPPSAIAVIVQSGGGSLVVWLSAIGALLAGIGAVIGAVFAVRKSRG